MSKIQCKVLQCVLYYIFIFTIILNHARWSEVALVCL